MIGALAKIPDADVPVTPAIEAALADSVRYLGSDAALRSIETDTYWPKWDSPWWHMLTLWELGEARQIPERTVRAMVTGLNALPVKTFPLRDSDMPPGTDSYRHASCHCALGSMYQVLAACGLEVDRELPWALPWFVTNQMADGGLSCDGEAYLVEGECPSSMVGTVTPLEAVLLGPWTPERIAFADRAGAFLVERRVMLGSRTKHNTEERDREPSWQQLGFPRLYLYDVLRGARALTRWAEARERTIPRAAIEPVIAHLLAAFPDGVVRVQRRVYEGIGTRTPAGARAAATRFPLLEATSVVGEPSRVLTRQWAELRHSVQQLAEAGRIVD